ncbi:hypothetical protein [Aeromicrobium sp. UC242_57]|uniref:divisome protein SepX/GlpR n=1 Tax=Aeromicrobium sp. UC242_57 TaxID=3374624 RepID=UPI003797C123
MGPSAGLIIAFVVVVWAAYFIPLALRRYDEASKDASVEGSGSLSRVIAWPGAGRTADEATEVVTPAETETVAEAPTAKPVRTLDRPAARLAARRRRRTLLTLLGLAVVVTGLAVAGVIALPFIAAPVTLIVAWLVACRIQVRGERGISSQKTPRATKIAGSLAGKVKATAQTAKTQATTKSKSKTKAKTKGKSTVSTAADEEETIIVSGQFEDVDPGRPHVMEVVALEDDALDDKIVIAVPSVSTTGEALWDPLPVTLPTYVTKPRAGRTVRTIDFSQPGTWTSGHIEGENVELPAQADEPGEERRAVGH